VFTFIRHHTDRHSKTPEGEPGGKKAPEQKRRFTLTVLPPSASPPSTSPLAFIPAPRSPRSVPGRKNSQKPTIRPYVKSHRFRLNNR
jgi:hypothetical protein